MPSTSSTDTASSSSTSPNLSASPLATLSSMTGALPSSGESDAHSRENSYDSSADVLAGEDEQRRHSMDDSDDALRKYKEGLFLYTTARFDRFKTDLERKQRSAGTNGLSRRSSSG